MLTRDSPFDDWWCGSRESNPDWHGPRPRASAVGARTASCHWFTGASPGTRTLNLPSKSRELCAIELARRASGGVPECGVREGNRTPVLVVISDLLQPSELHGHVRCGCSRTRTCPLPGFNRAHRLICASQPKWRRCCFRLGPGCRWGSTAGSSFPTCQREQRGPPTAMDVRIEEIRCGRRYYGTPGIVHRERRHARRRSWPAWAAG
jgi:hypothetical protein